MHWHMKAEELALVQGWDDTRAALRRWNADPWAILGTWARGSLAVTGLLLVATWLVAVAVTADPSGYAYPGIAGDATLGDFGFVLFRNGLVLALHALACVAGFMAGSSLPQIAGNYTGVWRRIHEKAGPLAIGFVICATAFSLATQAYALGHGAADLAAEEGMSPLLLLIALSPHAVLELFALFLPLAAWTLASRRGNWNELLAATFVTTTIAAPLLLLAASIEVWVSPRVVLALAG
jgi:hypothetical protein